jgi:sulfonate transport system substrate-binding protein
MPPITASLPRPRARALVALAVAVLGLALATASRADAVTIKVGGQTDGLKSLLQASGALKGTPYTVQWATFTSGPPIVEALQAGKIDVGGVGNTPVIFGAASRANFKLVATLSQKQHRGDYLIVPTDSSIKGFADLKGKRIAYTRGSSGHGYLIQALARAGLKTSQVTLVDLSPSDSLAAFSSGKVDAWATWEPFVSIAQKIVKGGARGLPAKDDYAASGLNFEIASNAALADKGKRAAIKDYVARLKRALDWGYTHQDVWAQAFKKETNLPDDISKQAIARTTVNVLPVSASIVAQEQTLANALTKAGVVKQVKIASLVENLL